MKLKNPIRYLSLHLGEKSILKTLFSRVKNSSITPPTSLEFSLAGNVFIGGNGRGKTVLLKHLASASNRYYLPRQLIFDNRSGASSDIVDGEGTLPLIKKLYCSFNSNTVILFLSKKESNLFLNSRFVHLSRKYRGCQHCAHKSHFDAVISNIPPRKLMEWRKGIREFELTKKVGYLNMAEDNKVIDENPKIINPRWKISFYSSLQEDKVTEYFETSFYYFKPPWSLRYGKIEERSHLSHGQFNMRYLTDYLQYATKIPQEEKTDILLFDEVDSGLSTGSQKEMAGLLERLVEEANHQLFFSTHSPLVLKEIPKKWRIFDLNKSPFKVYERGELTDKQIYKIMEE